MENIVQVSHILLTYFMRLYASENTAKYEKQVKYLPTLHEANMVSCYQISSIINVSLGSKYVSDSIQPS